MDPLHDIEQQLLELRFFPRTPLRILGHLEAGHRDAAGVGSLAGRAEGFRVFEDVHPSRSVGMFAPSETAMQRFLTSVRASSPSSSFWAHRQRHVAGHAPGRLPPWKVALLNSLA